MVKKRMYKPKNDNEFLGQISFIIFVAGFRYSIVEQRWPRMKKAFSNFSVTKLEKYGEKDIDKLMKAKDMIKNRQKISAVIKNAQIIRQIQKEDKSVLNLIAKTKRAYKKDPLFNPSLGESFQGFARIGKTTSGWLSSLHNAKGKYLEYEM